MKDEIKEILDNLIRYRYSDYECKQPEDVLTTEDMWLLLDYITNLQEERDMYKGSFEEMSKNYFEEKKKIDKAIELINKHSNYPTYYLTGNIVKDLLNLLQGKSDE